MQQYNIHRVYVSGVQESVPVREASRLFFRGHHLYDENFYPIIPVQYHGRGTFRLQPSTNTCHPPYTATMNGGIQNSYPFLGKVLEVERARVAFVGEEPETPITSNALYRTSSFMYNRSTRTGARLSFSAPATVHGSPVPSIVSTHRAGGPLGPVVDEWEAGVTQLLTQQARRELGWVEKIPAIAVEGSESRLIVDWQRLLNEEVQRLAYGGGQHGNQNAS